VAAGSARAAEPGFSFPWDQADLTIKLPRSKWAQLGVTYPDGKPLPNDDMPASLLLPMGRTGPAFLAYPNFAAYTEWNNSLIYSTTAGYLATRIAGAPPMRQPPRRSRNCRSTSSRSCSSFWCARASMSARSTA
jgi:membrane-bound lytic murein transglycosylase B